MTGSCFLQTGQKSCYDADGREIPCAGSGQDAELSLGIPWPAPRFETSGQTALDLLTGLSWPLDASPAEFPLDWQAAMDFVEGMNSRRAFGFDDWRLPGRRELGSLISFQNTRPALPANHPFTNVFQNWYWTSAAAAVDPAYAWYVHMGGGRMFYGAKAQYFMLWPVRGQGKSEVFCPLPTKRFRLEDEGPAVLDSFTGLRWMRMANLTGRSVAWDEALVAIKALDGWHLPNINELESLVDVKRHHPALPPGHPFLELQEVYWSSTTSTFEPDWAWALYLDKGAVGVGRKRDARFHVWAVSSR